MAHIIPLNTKATDGVSPAQVVQAAWQFAHAALWQEQTFPTRETNQVHEQIEEFFKSGGNAKEPFLIFCERIILANRLLATEPSRYLPNPSVWFNRNFPHGYAATEQLYHNLQGQRSLMPKYQQGSRTLSLQYWQYINEPSEKTFSSCRNKLLQLKEYGLIQLFYNSIIYHQFLKTK